MRGEVGRFLDVMYILLQICIYIYIYIYAIYCIFIYIYIYTQRDELSKGMALNLSSITQ